MKTVSNPGFKYNFFIIIFFIIIIIIFFFWGGGGCVPCVTIRGHLHNPPRTKEFHDNDVTERIFSVVDVKPRVEPFPSDFALRHQDATMTVRLMLKYRVFLEYTVIISCSYQIEMMKLFRAYNDDTIFNTKKGKFAFDYEKSSKVSLTLKGQIIDTSFLSLLLLQLVWNHFLHCKNW